MAGVRFRQARPGRRSSGQGLHGARARRRPARQRPPGVRRVPPRTLRGGRRHERRLPDAQEHVAAAGARRSVHSARPRDPDDARYQGPHGGDELGERAAGHPADAERVRTRPAGSRRSASWAIARTAVSGGPTRRSSRRAGTTTCRSRGSSSTASPRRTTGSARSCSWSRPAAGVSRRIATELFERTGDEELGHLLGFFYDTVQSADLGDDELTYDISVPDNVTYIANGFVSHNTIGLLMDCDTTGVEPDLGLVKTKKLVGGGTMSIVNQTVPRALAKLGYGPDQVDEIVAYVNEHMSIVGAPHLAPEHMAGVRLLHGRQHHPLLGPHPHDGSGATLHQSGAISKTVNLPEDVTVEDVEQLHVDAWRLGIKAVAIYRDNCKVAQPLSTTKKEREVVEGGDSAPAGSEAEAKDREIAARIAELETALAHEQERRPSPSWWAPSASGCPASATRRRSRSGWPTARATSPSASTRTAGPVRFSSRCRSRAPRSPASWTPSPSPISLGLQHQVPLATFVTKYANMKFEPAGITDDPELRIASSLLDYIFRRVALDYLTQEERTDWASSPPTSGTSRHCPASRRWRRRRSAWSMTAWASVPGAATPAPLASPATPRRRPLRQHRDQARGAPPVSPRPGPSSATPPFCYNCGNVMQRAGSCYVCGSCGSTSGCS